MAKIRNVYENRIYFFQLLNWRFMFKIISSAKKKKTDVPKNEEKSLCTKTLAYISITKLKISMVEKKKTIDD